MEVGFQFIGIGIFAWLIYGGPQKMMEEWRKGKEAGGKCRCCCHETTD